MNNHRRSLSILILPLFTMPSGHQQVAAALTSSLLTLQPHCDIHTIDVFSYAYGRWERWISNFYLRWIQLAPYSYQMLYRQVVQDEQPNHPLFTLYGQLFMWALRRLLRDIQPDLIFCTHSLPSYLCAQLKKTGQLNIPVINVYTDYVVNQLWGTKGVDWHFCPDSLTAAQLQARAVPPEHLLITGIPLDPGFAYHAAHLSNRSICCEHPHPDHSERPYILVSGGHAGLMNQQWLLEQIVPLSAFDIKILCGKNQALQTMIKQLSQPHVHALGYIDNKAALCQLYQGALAMITKAGGSTLTECIRLQLPTFVDRALPGQEQANLRHLTQQQVIVHLTDSESVLQQITPYLQQTCTARMLRTRLANYNRQFYNERQVAHFTHCLSRLIERHW